MAGRGCQWLANVMVVVALTACQFNDVVDEGWPCSPIRPCAKGWTCIEGVCVPSSVTSDEDTSTPPGGETWKDSTSGLTWQVTPTGGTMNWSDAKSHCAGLTLDGGGWHLPTIGELRTLIRGCSATETSGTCNVKEGQCVELSCKDNSCSGCANQAGPAGGLYWPEEIQGGCCWYWSSSPVEDYGGDAWGVRFNIGRVVSIVVNYVDYFVLCVR
jgi:hypothetical protein